jgi:hypothetical protein
LKKRLIKKENKFVRAEQKQKRERENNLPITIRKLRTNTQHASGTTDNLPDKQGERNK